MDEVICDLILDLAIAHGLTGGVGMIGYNREEQEFLERVITVISQGSESTTGFAPVSIICESAFGGGEGGGEGERGIHETTPGAE
jgi:hypothetical protein